VEVNFFASPLAPWYSMMGLNKYSVWDVRDEMEFLSFLT
jgi:hypothetical protein